MSKDVLGLVFQLRKYVGHCYREVKSISDPIWLPYRYGFTSGDLSSSSKFRLKWKGVRKCIVNVLASLTVVQKFSTASQTTSEKPKT